MANKMTNRQLAALETKRKLLETTKKLVYEKGLTNTSVEEITKLSGVSNGTFYTYFKRKEDIIFALSKEIFSEIAEQAQNNNGTFLQRLSDYMVNFSAHIEKNGLKLCQEWVRNTVDPNLVENPDDRQKLRMDLDAMQSLIENGIARGELQPDAPVEALARALVALLYGEMLCWDMSDGAHSFEERTKEFCTLFLNNLIKPYLKEGEESV